MSVVPLRRGPLAPSGYRLLTSGVRWLFKESRVCRPGEIVAYCYVKLVPDGPGPLPFADEWRDLVVAFATRAGGQLQRGADTARGGQLDELTEFDEWKPDEPIGHIRCRPSERPPGADEPGGALRVLMMAGRRVTGLAEDRSAPLAGWHDRVRAWWGDGGATRGSLLGFGICEQTGVFRAGSPPFAPWFQAVPGPVHVAHVPDPVLVPCVPVVLDQCRRTLAEAEAIRDDFSRSLASGPVAPTPGDWIFAGALVAALLRSPLTETGEILAREGYRRIGPPDAVVLSLNAEGSVVLRHRRLGYALHCHGYRLGEAGDAVRAWLARDFEPVARTPDDVRRDYRELVHRLRAGSRTAVLVMNMMSSSGFETQHSYAPFDAPLGNTLGTVRAKELNLMLHDLAREGCLSIVDNDAIAADMGSAHLPDGVHNSGALQAELRSEILRILRAQGVPGFA